MLLNPTVLPSDQYDLTKILWGWAQIVRGVAEYDLGSSKEEVAEFDLVQIILVAWRDK